MGQLHRNLDTLANERVVSDRNEDLPSIALRLVDAR
jgi:hypothetical protein